MIVQVILSFNAQIMTLASLAGAVISAYYKYVIFLVVTAQ